MALLEITTATDTELAGIRNSLQIGDRNAANGFLGLDENGHAIGTFAQRVGLDADINTIVLANGELAYTTDTLEVRIGDGTTAGGIFLYAKPQIAVGRLGPLTTTDTAYASITGKAGGLYRTRAFVRVATAGMRLGVSTPTGQAIGGTAPFSMAFGGFRNVTNNTLPSALTGVGSTGGFPVQQIDAAGDYYCEGVARGSGSAPAGIVASHASSTGSVFDLFYLELQRIG